MLEKEIIRKLLEIDLNNFALKLGFVNGQPQEISYDVLIAALGLLKDVSNREESDFNSQVAIAIVSLLWTHSGEDLKIDLRQLIAPILSTMGFAPSNLMLDPALRKEGKYSELSSYFAKLRIIAHDLKNQVLVKDTTYTLTAFQRDLWRVIDENQLIGISAPTSAGKSFLIYLKVVEAISRGASRIIYVVPTLSLISQVTSDISQLLRKHQLNEIEVLNSYEQELQSFIYVVTQERAIVLFSEEGIKNLDILIVDEVQNLEKVASDGESRPKILYDVMMDVRSDVEVGKIILSGPRLKNIANLGFQVFGEESAEKSTDAPPVLSLTYSVSKQDKKFFINQYSALFDTPLRLRISEDKVINGLGKTTYTEQFNLYLHHVLGRLAGDVNVVFSPTASQARRSANEYTRALGEQFMPENPAELNNLRQYLEESVHPRYELAKMAKRGVAYHTGKTPMHVRKSIEFATSMRWIDTLFCTTTLMQGVNLPANNVVIRNPNLFTRRQAARNVTLSPYEFANLRGRAGRLLVDFIGRTVVLDEDSFSVGRSEDETGSLFPEEYKEIKTGYQDVYSRNSQYVDNALVSADTVDDHDAKGLVTFIRQTLYRHGDAADNRLRNVGLNIEAHVLTRMSRALQSLTVPPKVVLANRYWDPVDLDLLFKLFRLSPTGFPTNVFTSNLVDNLLTWVSVIRDKLPSYFNRYLNGAMSDKYLFGVCKSAESWAREKPLREILVGRFGVDSAGIDDQIDSEIEKLTRYVSYGLPMLLKPVADMQSLESSIISAIELGVHTPISKYLTDRGVPRETSIKISRLHRNAGLNTINQRFAYDKLNMWERQHVDHILS
jgi:hypothetical protein